MSTSTQAQESEVVGERYELRSSLSQGALDSLHIAHDRVLNRMVVIRRTSQGLSSAVLESLRAWYRLELQGLGVVRHPNLREIYDAELTSDRPWMAIEPCTGPGLSVLMRSRGTFSQEEVCWILDHMGRVLDALHGLGALHLDLQPASWIFHQERLKLSGVGVGLSGLVRANMHPDAPPPALYRAPEQIRGQSPTAATDRFTVGVVLYELLTGACPHEAPPETLETLILEGRFEPVTSLVEGLDPGWDAFFVKALALDPQARFSTVAAMADAVAQFVPRHTWTIPDKLEQHWRIAPQPSLRGASSLTMRARLSTLPSHPPVKIEPPPRAPHPAGHHHKPSSKGMHRRALLAAVPRAAARATGSGIHDVKKRSGSHGARTGGARGTSAQGGAGVEDGGSQLPQVVEERFSLWMSLLVGGGVLLGLALLYVMIFES